MHKTPAQTQALVNELKGHVFEYLVGLELARGAGVEGRFLRSFGGAAKIRLREYEVFLRSKEPALSARLPAFADQAARALAPSLPGGVRGVLVCGKSSGGRRAGVEEGDLLVETEGAPLPVSLKLCKSDSFVHTKSAGVRSFLGKYFAAPAAQRRLDRGLDDSFLTLGRELYELAGLCWSGEWNEDWAAAGMPSLPGRLDKQPRALVLAHYRRVIGLVRRELEQLWRDDPAAFSAALAPLIGFGNGDILQVVCFYQAEGVEVVVSEREGDPCRFLPWDGKTGSFHLSRGSRILQLRAKPMNRFDVPALKINCAFKWAAR